MKKTFLRMLFAVGVGVIAILVLGLTITTVNIIGGNPNQVEFTKILFGELWWLFTILWTLLVSAFYFLSAEIIK